LKKISIIIILLLIFNLEIVSETQISFDSGIGLYSFYNNNELAYSYFYELSVNFNLFTFPCYFGQKGVFQNFIDEDNFFDKYMYDSFYFFAIYSKGFKLGKIDSYIYFYTGLSPTSLFYESFDLKYYQYFVINDRIELIFSLWFILDSNYISNIYNAGCTYYFNETNYMRFQIYFDTDYTDKTISCNLFFNVLLNKSRLSFSITGFYGYSSIGDTYNPILIDNNGVEIYLGYNYKFFKSFNINFFCDYYILIERYSILKLDINLQFKL